MKTINLKNSGEVVYYERLNNGLDVYMYSKEGYHNNYVTFTTKFGSIYNEFIPIDQDKMIKVPNGIAHFLEHKVFVQENDPQPDDFFANNGAICNAYTTFKNTTYLFSGTDYLKENLSFLLDYVQSPYFTDDNVNSEKGIITQEINMCNDAPSDTLYEAIRRNAFKNNPFKESIIGKVDDINKITPDILYTCYNSFYHPANMFLVVTGSFSPEEILQVIKNNQDSKTFPDFKPISIKEYNEEDTVSKELEIININTDISKVAYNIKINPSNLGISKRKLNLYLFIVFSLLFDDSSLFTEKEKEKGIITSSVSINLLNCDSHILLSFVNQTDKYNELLNDLKEELKKIKIDEKDFNRKKKVLISNELFSFENIEVVNEMIVDSIIFDGNFNDDNIGLIKNLNYEELEDILERIDLSNTSTVILKK